MNHSPNTASVRGADNTKYIQRLRDTGPFKSGRYGLGQMIWLVEGGGVAVAEMTARSKLPRTFTEVEERHAEDG